MITYTLRPLPIWPHPVTEPRRSIPFKAGYNSTLRLLDQELRMLEASNVILGVGLAEGDIRRDGAPRSGARYLHPGVELSFDSRFGRLVYATDVYQGRWTGDMADWQANLRAIALSLEALRAVERHGVANRGQQYAGWKALPSGRGIIIANLDEAWDILGQAAGEGNLGKEGPMIRARFDPQELYRRAAKRVHPDVGGSKSAFLRVQAAYELLKAGG